MLHIRINSIATILHCASKTDPCSRLLQQITKCAAI